MYLSEDAKDALINAISETGAGACTLLAECAGDEASHPPTYMAGYLQGYVHAVDAVCALVEHPEKIMTR